MNKTVGELMFDGYEDPVMQMGAMTEEESESNVPMDKFGWFYKVAVVAGKWKPSPLRGTGRPGQTAT